MNYQDSRVSMSCVMSHNCQGFWR